MKKLIAGSMIIAIAITSAVASLPSGYGYVVAPTNSTFSGVLNGANTNHNDLVGRELPNAHPTSAITGLDSALVIATNRPAFQVFTGLTGNITLTNNLEAPISISGTGSISVAFSGLVSPYPVYLTAQGFSSLTFPAGSYLVGGGMWQTNRVNHFVVWQYSTNLYVNPVVTTEIE